MASTMPSASRRPRSATCRSCRFRWFDADCWRGRGPTRRSPTWGARVVGEGANFAVIDAKSSGDLLFREQVGGVWLASPIQVYLDLLRGEGRAKELAEHLRRERIGF